MDTQITKPATPKNKEAVKAAIEKGKATIKAGGTKADAARAMYELIRNEDREVICDAFRAGAGLTEKGAMTYFYNAKRAATKQASK